MKHRRVWVGLLVLCLLVISAAPWLSAKADTGPLTMHFIDVGQGDACWIHLPNGNDVLIDGGKPQAGPTVVAYLQAHDVDDIEHMILSHPHADHIGGLIDVIESFDVD